MCCAEEITKGIKLNLCRPALSPRVSTTTGSTRVAAHHSLLNGMRLTLGTGVRNSVTVPVTTTAGPTTMTRRCRVVRLFCGS